MNKLVIDFLVGAFIPILGDMIMNLLILRRIKF